MEKRIEKVIESLQVASGRLVSYYKRDTLFRFRAQGGCPTCKGSRRVVTWSTLDGDAYTEYGQCPDLNHYDHTISLEKTPSQLFNPDCPDSDLYDRIQKAIKPLHRLKSEIYDARDPMLRDRVRVYKGRKVPIGTTGTLIKISEGAYGTRGCVVDHEGRYHWTALSNLEAVISRMEELEQTIQQIEEVAAQLVSKVTV